MRRNPPWTDKVLERHWSALEARVGAGWMPLLATEHKGLANLRDMVRRIRGYIDDSARDEERKALWRRQVDDLEKTQAKFARARKLGYQEFGCGRYGCVMPTATPGIVLKVTTDPTEASFVAAYLSLAPTRRPMGIVPYHRLLAIRSESRLRRPVFVLWRDEAKHVGGDAIEVYLINRLGESSPDVRSFIEALRTLNACLHHAGLVRSTLKGAPNAKAVIARAIQLAPSVWERGSPPAGRDRDKKVAWGLAAFRANAEGLLDNRQGYYLGRGLLDSLQCGLLLADVHLDNIGLPTGKLEQEIGETPIITDPGHAVALDDRYAGVRIEEL